MLMIQKQNSLVLIAVLCLQVLTSPLNKYHPHQTDCQTIQLPVRISRDNAQAAGNHSTRSTRQQLRNATTPETIVVTDRMASGAQTTRQPATGGDNRRSSTTTMGTIVVRDTTDSARYPDRNEMAETNNTTYCDRLARREAQQGSDDGGGDQMFCVDYINCPSIEREVSSSKIRRLTCGLKLDGTIRVCCRDYDRSSLSEEELTGGRVIGSDEVFSSTSGEVDEEEEEERESSSPNQKRAPPSRVSIVAGKSGTTMGRNGSSRSLTHEAEQATVIVNESQKLNVSKPVKGNRELGTSETLVADNRLSALRRPTQQVHEKFPRDCGLAQSGYNDQDELRIIGGKSARRNAWPWFALLLVQRRRKFEPECGATLITNRHVLTAAHCVLLQGGKRAIPKHQLRVRLGEFNLREQGDGELDFDVEKIIAHREFNQRTFKNDIAIVKLSHNVSQFNESIWPACLAGLDGRQARLAPQNWNAVDNQTAWVLGFGQTSYNGRTSDQLRQADLRIVPLGKCKRAFAHLVKLNRDYVCASSELDDSGDADSSKPAGKLKDSCQGDSGGPLMMTMGFNASDPVSDQPVQTPFERWYIYGIVSFGFKCAVPNFAGVYCRVNRYLDWIAANTEF